jgi:hypothetical protein
VRLGDEAAAELLAGAVPVPASPHA